MTLDELRLQIIEGKISRHDFADDIYSETGEILHEGSPEGMARIIVETLCGEMTSAARDRLCQSIEVACDAWGDVMSAMAQSDF